MHRKLYIQRNVVFQAKSAIIATLVACACMISCSQSNTVTEIVSLDENSIPLMHAETISALISSDSGDTRHRLNAKVWDVISTDEGLVWYFPEGLYVEQFDSLFQVEASVEADTAYKFLKTDIWRLVKNVRIVNLEQTEFTTSEFFWNEKKQIVYSDSVVYIKEKGDESGFKSIGFWSRQDMTRYTFYKPFDGAFTVNENEPDSLNNTKSNVHE